MEPPEHSFPGMRLHPLVVGGVYAAVSLLVFSAYATQIFNLFYFNGATSHDQGWFAYLLSRFDIVAANPLYIQERGIASFYAYHLSPIMPLWGGLAELLGWSPTTSFAVYQGFFHVVLALCGAGLADTGLPRPWNLAFRVFVGLSLAFSPVAMNALMFPHHELAIPILFIATCLAIWRGRMVFAWVVFVLMLTVRTDAGFHAAVFFGAFALAELIVERNLSLQFKRAFIFAAVGFFASVIAFAIVKYGFPSYSNLRTSYLGPSGFFEHLTLSFFFDRIGNLVDKRPELVLPFLFILGLGIVKRDLRMAAGALAVLPWTILHLVAYRDIPGELYTYYAFPYLALMAWPFLVPALRAGSGKRPQPPVNTGFAPIWIAVVIAGLIIYFSVPFSSDKTIAAERSASVANFLPRVGVDEVNRVSAFAAQYFKIVASPIDVVLMDEAMVSLLPNTSRENFFWTEHQPVPNAGGSFVIAYFSRYAHAAEIERRYLPIATQCFAVAGTGIRLLSHGNGDILRSVYGAALHVRDCAGRNRE